MRIAVLSDIHGNLPALEAVLAAMAPYDAVWQLGDIVGYGPQPNEVIARLIDEGARGVRGNHDSAAIGMLATEAFNDEAAAAIEWTAEQLSPVARKWLAGLPTRAEDGPFTLVHGSPRDPMWEYVYSVGVARANMARFTTQNCLVGHTHVPMLFRRRSDAVVEPVAPGDDDPPLALDEWRSIINPGSVGQPRDGDPRAGAMLIDDEQGTVEWRRVEYPIEPVQQLMLDAGLPLRLAARLSFGL
ncbi:MAG TPA: metallophosphoesterase family protein [Candidatus Limnocylindria bacterium]|nr:metallophosphoesterase family protein [Candidatus Limnocylindria bacterium]